MFFSYKKCFLDFIKAKADTLLKPYFVTLFLVGIVEVFIKGGDWFAYSFGAAYGTAPSIKWIQLWFLPHLFLLFLFSYTLFKFFNFDRCKRLIQIAILFLFSQEIKRFSFNPLYLIISLLIFSLVHYFCNSSLDFSLRIYEHALLTTLHALFGICFLFCLASLLAKVNLVSSLLVLLGRTTLVVFIFHWFFMGHTYKLLGRIGVSNILVLETLSIAIGITAPIVLSIFLKRFYPLRALFFQK